MKIIIILIVTLVVVTGCRYDKELLAVPCNSDNRVSFKSKVLPVIQSNCFSCHNNGFRLGNISLEGHNNIKVVAQSGRLFGVINHSAGFTPMPRGGSKLDDCTITTIKNWIENGTPDN